MQLYPANDRLAGVISIITDRNGRFVQEFCWAMRLSTPRTNQRRQRLLDRLKATEVALVRAALLRNRRAGLRAQCIDAMTGPGRLIDALTFKPFGAKNVHHKTYENLGHLRRSTMCVSGAPRTGSRIRDNKKNLRSFCTARVNTCRQGVLSVRSDGNVRIDPDIVYQLSEGDSAVLNPYLLSSEKSNRFVWRACTSALSLLSVL